MAADARGVPRARRDAAARRRVSRFEPDACLVNRYVPGARLSLHRDADERDFTQPIVSVSLGLPATFVFGGANRTDPTSACRWNMATSSSGAARRGCATTACSR